MPRMTTAEGRAWTARWRAVEEAEREELRTTPVEVKFRQLAVMMEAARELGWSSEASAEEEMAARDKWIRLRKAYGVR